MSMFSEPYCIRCVFPTSAQVPHRRCQPKDNLSCYLLSNANSKHVLADDLNTDAEGSKKAVRFGSSHAVEKFDHVNAEHAIPKYQSKSSFHSRSDFWISHFKHGLVRGHVEPRDCPVALHALESQRQNKFQQCISSLFQQLPPILVHDDWRTAVSTDMRFHWVGRNNLFYNQSCLSTVGT